MNKKIAIVAAAGVVVAASVAVAQSANQTTTADTTSGTPYNTQTQSDMNNTQSDMNYGAGAQTSADGTAGQWAGERG